MLWVLDLEIDFVKNVVWFHFPHVIDDFYLRRSLGFDIAICVFMCVCGIEDVSGQWLEQEMVFRLSCFKVPWCCLWVWRWSVSCLMLLVLEMLRFDCDCFVLLFGIVGTCGTRNYETVFDWVGVLGQCNLKNAWLLLASIIVGDGWDFEKK